MIRYLFIAVLTVSTLGACRHRGESDTSTVPRVDARRTRRLLSIAARDLNCPADTLVSEQVTERIYRVRGCNDWRDYAIFGGRRHRAARWRRIVPIADRVATDFGCAATEITFTPATATSYTAIGCGKASGYELRCTETDCGWAGTPPPAGTATASVVIIVPATTAPLSIDIDGEVEDDGEGE